MPGPAVGERILLVDDERPIVDACSMGLKRAGYQVSGTTNPHDAIDLAIRDPYDLLLTDIMMPRLDGAGLLKALRADQRTLSIPVILLSARAGEESRIEGLAAGADDYLVKPFSARELLARVGVEEPVDELHHRHEVLAVAGLAGNHHTALGAGGRVDLTGRADR